MKTTTKLLYTTMALGILALPLAANAQTLENVRVRLPNGQLLTLGENNWQHDTRVVQYNRYYYEPAHRTYVVYDEKHPPFHGKAKYKAHTIRHDQPKHPDHDHDKNNNHGRH